MAAQMIRGLVSFLAALLLASAPHSAIADADWDLFKREFVSAEGRVVDTGQAGISHSEGQGYAMIFAVHHADRAALDKLWQWTRVNLQVRDDALLAWRWQPEGGATDRNNASDGDLLVAWALWRAHERWRDPAHAAAARRLAADIRAKLVRRSTHGLVLVPGLDGFDKVEGQVINLSYWVYPALRDLERADPSPEWAQLAANGLDLLGYSYFGRWRLPPDWLRLGPRVAPAGPPPERFGYDAVRIPVYLLWARRDTEALMKPYRDFWGHYQGARDLPAWTNLKDDSVDSQGASAGIRAIAQVAVGYPRVRAEALPALEKGQSYYSAVLLLLCKVALRERGD